MTPEEFIAIRKELNLNQTALGREIGYSQSQIRRFESGDNEIPLVVIKALDGLLFESTKSVCSIDSLLRMALAKLNDYKK